LAKDLIGQFLQCPDAELLPFLRAFRDRPKFKVCRYTNDALVSLCFKEDFFHWADVFDRFDDILAKAAPAKAPAESGLIPLYTPGEVWL
jgi:hypothetical protein